MEIKQIELHNFRNYSQQKIEFEAGINLLVGANGQGKTNALESIHYLATGKSYRVKQESELILWGKKNFYLKGSFQTADRLLTLESYYEAGKKVMKINQLACRRLSDYVGTINAVFFSPEDLNIVKKGPSERRRFLDLLLAQIRPSHIALLNDYIKIIKQKNNLLKTVKNSTALKSQLPIWNEQLVAVGSKIIANRWELTVTLNSYCRPIFKSIFSQEDNMDLYYLALNKNSLEEALETFPEILDKKMNQEIERKTVLIGPHRDELLINLNDKPARLFASQGQQRSLVLCLKLAEMEIIFNKKGEYPILLLDDVLSELDEERRRYLLAYINTFKKQTLITMTEADEKIIKEKTAVYRVFKGNIRRER
ncbi:MAG TPA: DNA replication/repair protein RecF [Peptococcaceae bacterium]|nr:DNA replication/repair protein RecF [Peptococcaceae bacterium]